MLTIWSRCTWLTGCGLLSRMRLQGWDSRSSSSSSSSPTATIHLQSASAPESADLQPPPPLPLPRFQIIKNRTLATPMRALFVSSEFRLIACGRPLCARAIVDFGVVMLVSAVLFTVFYVACCCIIQLFASCCCIRSCETALICARDVAMKAF